jgi:lipoyl-dependent peroxiredoxin subunit D
LRIPAKAGRLSFDLENTMEELKNRLPDYAKDLRLNLSSLAAEGVLDAEKKAGTFVAAAAASRNSEVIRAVMAEFGARLDPSALKAAQAAAAIMAMNNVYYRFTHLVATDEYARLPAKLRMNALANPGTAKENFELWSLAVSAVNGCGRCIVAHERVLREAGLTTDEIQAAVRIAAVIQAVAATLEAADAMQEEALPT